jgi:ABC-type transport system substrate-binding protein
MRSSTIIAVLILAAGDVGAAPWNNPYPAADAAANVYYDSFEERPKHLDPARSYAENEGEFIGQVYEPPLQYHYLRRPYELVPLTVREIPTPVYLDADGRELPEDAPADRIARSVYRFRLQAGIRFQPHPALARDPQGAFLYHALTPADLAAVHTLADLPVSGTRELVAADYVYQIKRLADPALASPVAGLMFEHIVGLREYAERLGRLRAGAPTGGQGGFLDLRGHDLDGARVIDRYTWEVTIKGKYPQFLYWQAMTFFAPVPWEADRFHAQPGLAERNITLDWFPIGTGPYMLTENNPNRRMVLVRNPNFRGERYPGDGEMEDGPAGLLADAGRPMPFVDRAVYSLETESIPRWSKFLQGYYDISGIPSDSFDQALQYTGAGLTLTGEMQRRGIGLLTAVSASTSYVGFNMLDPVVGGDGERARKLRRAIAIAADTEEYISIFRNGRGVAAQGPVPPGLFGAREGQASINPYLYTWADGQPQRRPLEEARDLLAEAGYPGGRDPATGRALVLYFDTSASGPDFRSMLDWWRKQFAKLGIQLVVRDSDFNRFQDKLARGNAQIFQFGWNADYPDPENFLFLLAGGQAKVRYAGENAANYSNPEFDRLFEQMRHMDNSPERQRIIDGMVEIARRDGPWLWGFHPTGYTLMHSWYANAKPNLMARNTLKYKRVDPLLRAERRSRWNAPVWQPLAWFAAILAAGLLPAIRVYRRRQRATAL